LGGEWQKMLHHRGGWCGRRHRHGALEEEDAPGACMFLVDLPDPAITIIGAPNTIDNSMPGTHAELTIDNLRIPADQMLGQAGEGFKYAQVRLSPARLSHCMRWLGACIRAQEIATDYACRRHAFGKQLIEHEGVGFMLAENRILLKQCELMIDWCAGVLDTGSLGAVESSMTKVSVSEALMKVADNCVQTMGGTGVTDKTIVEQVFREIRAFRIYDGPRSTNGAWRQGHPPRVEAGPWLTTLPPPTGLWSAAHRAGCGGAGNMAGCSCARLCRAAGGQPVQRRPVQPDLSAGDAAGQLCAAPQACRADPERRA
jgi:hypothetical protein